MKKHKNKDINVPQRPFEKETLDIPIPDETEKKIERDALDEIIEGHKPKPKTSLLWCYILAVVLAVAFIFLLY